MPITTQARSHCVLLFIAIYASLTYDQSAVFERPTQSSICAFYGAAAALLGYRYPSQSDAKPPSGALQSKSDVAFIPLLRQTLVNIFFRPWTALRSISSTLKRRHILPLALATCGRVELFRFVSYNRQCTVFALDSHTPLVLALYDYWYFRWRRQHSTTTLDATSNLDEWGMPSEVSGDGGSYIPACFLLSVANLLSQWNFSGSRSTYICPLSSWGPILMPGVQVLSTVLECFIIIRAANLLKKIDSRGINPELSTDNSNDPTIIVASAFTTAAAILFLGGTLSLATHFQYWPWFFATDLNYLVSVSWSTILLGISVIATVQLLGEYGATHVASYLTFICVYASALRSSISSIDALPPVHYLSFLLFISSFFLSVVLYLVKASASGDLRKWKFSYGMGRRLRFNLYSCVIILALAAVWLLRPRTESTESHPLDGIINDATVEAGDWLQQASRGQTLEVAVFNYRKRYGRAPPPAFDVWYKYATQRSSLVIDDYDNMYEDLKPFWGLSPVEIRRRTHEIISDAYNDAARIMIRGGHTNTGANFKPTHRWMVEGFAHMMKDFLKFIPDMDIALNLNDEPRVAVPYGRMKSLLRAADSSSNPTAKVKKHQWDPNRDKQWMRAENAVASRPFGHKPRLNSFTAATAACPPSSPSRRNFLWDASLLCLSCAAPHSQGVFLSNWSLAASPCHQPDLRNLHGFYLSPAAFRTSTDLLPIFSQSKAGGFADILYPSPWNYIDKVLYAPTTDKYPDPAFSEKQNSLFWRGATSEGVSRFGTWKGMARQRLIHLASNSTATNSSSSAFFAPTTPMLLPDPYHESRYTYILPPNPAAILDGLVLNTSFVSIERAWDSDGPAQSAEFSPLSSQTDFQSHWQHRYLLDTDGAGFSGRFLPFLQSHSLPLRSGIFRTWYDHRLTAWAHFVPVDIRLHGLWSTLAYFVGTVGNKGAKTLRGRVGMEKRVKRGEEIAERGRSWAGKVLRKEDMEVYLFRLLLEWGRLTDDGREGLGFELVGRGDGGKGKGSERGKSNDEGKDSEKGKGNEEGEGSEKGKEGREKGEERKEDKKAKGD